jgi:hypothetical protein
MEDAANLGGGKTVRERERRRVREGNIRLRPCRTTDE